MVKRTTVLIVLDGWGIGRNDESNPIYVVKPVSFVWLHDNYPVTSLQASGIAVGLPWGEVGNSEVGTSDARCRESAIPVLSEDHDGDPGWRRFSRTSA